MTARRRTLVAVAVLAVLFLLPLRGLLRNQGPPMEEGFMLVFPERVLHGDLPNRDFLHLYGPGGLWVLAGVYKAFGVSLAAERLVALAQMVGLVAGVFVIARRWGLWLATTGAALSLVIIVPPIGLTALAWVGGVALALLGLAGGLARRALPLTCGLLCGAALLYRPDLVLAVGLGLFALSRGQPRAHIRRALVGVGIGVAPYAIHLATAGPSAVIRGLVIDPVFYLRGGRRLPIPPSPDHFDGFLQRAGALHAPPWPLPALRSPTQLTVWFFLLLVVVAFLVVAGARGVRRDPHGARSRALFAVALFSLGLLPQAVQRTDSTHLAWVSAVPFGFLPAALAEVVRGRHRQAIAVAASVGLVLLLIPHFTFRSYGDAVAQTFGRHRLAYRIQHDGRTFYYGRPDVAAAVTDLLADVDRLSSPGQRVLVGTGDLRKTPYSDAFLYYLLPDLVPATYYIEMDPGVANKEGSRLADDVASADFVILSRVWDDWDEPNDSRTIGSDEPNRVLRDEFCEVGSYGGGLYELLSRCDPGHG